MQPLDTGLNVAIAHIATKLFPGGFDVSPNAPSTLDQLKAHLDAGRRMVVFSSGSDTTIYADPEVNWCFRAWRDWCHWRGSHPFSFAGETAVYGMQADHLVTLYGDGPDVQRWIRIIHAEVIGQAEFYEAHGHFPADQYAFVVEYLERALPAQSIGLVQDSECRGPVKSLGGFLPSAMRSLGVFGAGGHAGAPS